jgi:hypothetical protein
MADWGKLANNALNTGMDALQGALKWAMENIPKFLANVPSMIGGLFNQGREAATDVIDAAAPQVAKLGNSATQAVSNTTEQLTSMVQDNLPNALPFSNDRHIS